MLAFEQVKCSLAGSADIGMLRRLHRLCQILINFEALLVRAAIDVANDPLLLDLVTSLCHLPLLSPDFFFSFKFGLL